MKILILGNGLPLRDHPLRIAEEIAMLDVMSGGRVVSGFVRGIGCEYYSIGVNPTHSQARFLEAHDLIIRAWTETGPFAFEGEHYRYRYVNIWPRPLQKPHPPIWIPSFGSRETAEWCAHPNRKYPFLATYLPESMIKGLFEHYRAVARSHGYEASPYQMGHLVPIYVAETDERARAEGGQHVQWLYHRGLRQVWEMLFPPGYQSTASMMRLVGAFDSINWMNLSFDEMNERGYCYVGSPDTVRRRLVESVRDLKYGHLMGIMQIGDMPHARAVKNMELFAREVMPALKAEFKKSAPVEANAAPA